MRFLNKLARIDMPTTLFLPYNCECMTEAVTALVMNELKAKATTAVVHVCVQ